MSLYSFCVKAKNGKFHRLKGISCEDKHSLQILDLISMQFDTKKDLMRYLDIDLNRFDDIAITYRSQGKDRKLEVILSGADELKDVAYSTIDFDYLSDLGDPSLQLALAYYSSKGLKIVNQVDIHRFGFDRIYRTFCNQASNFDSGVNVEVLNNQAVRLFNEGQQQLFLREVSKYYLTVRRMYSCLIENGALSRKENLEVSPMLTLKELVNDFFNSNSPNNPKIEMLDLLANLNLNDMESELINAILEGDNNAMAELMAFDATKLEKFREFLSLLPSYYQFQLKQGKVFIKGSND